MNDSLIEYTPSSFVTIFNQSIEYSFGLVSVEGEISSFRVAKNKWVYFDLKDDEATLRCFGTVYMLPGPLQDGMMVRVVCAPRLHPQFNFSLNIQSVVPVGEGAIAKQAELLFQKLEAEGLFAIERKRRLPFAPERIALVTSAESAAYADFTKICAIRWPKMVIDVYDVQVQGIAAPEHIARAFERINGGAVAYDTVVLVRGGGSAEDLAAFNDERIVRAVVGSRFPTMVAIGHETDESLAELASDARASTPSNAAELLVPDRESESVWLEHAQSAVYGSLRSSVADALRHSRRVREQLLQDLANIAAKQRHDVGEARIKLDLINPAAVLKRGYVQLRKSGTLIKSTHDVSVGDSVDIILYDGTRKAEIRD